MFMKKVAACLTGAMVLVLALQVLAWAQTPETTADSATPAAQEAAEKTARPQESTQPDETKQSDETRQSNETQRPSVTEAANPEPSPLGDARPENIRTMALFLDGKDVTDSVVTLKWPDAAASAPTALIRAVGPDGQSISPVFSSSDTSVVAVDASGLAIAAGYGVATITATLGAQTASLQISVGQPVERVVIIAEDSVLPGHSLKLRAFDQDGNRISVLWRSSSEKVARINSDGVLTARRGAAGQTVDVTALAGEGSGVFAVMTIQIG